VTGGVAALGKEDPHTTQDRPFEVEAALRWVSLRRDVTRHELIGEGIAQAISPDAIRRVMDAQTLRTHLREWLHYPGIASPVLVARMLARIALPVTQF
jgi:hypothetical protein